MSASAGRQPRILFVINSLTGGGAERVMATLITASQARTEAAEVALVLLDRAPRAYPLPDWLTVYQLDCRGQLARSVRQLRDIVRVFRPDATLSFLTRSNLATVMLARRHGYAAVISERANTSGHFGRGVAGAAARWLVGTAYPRAAAVIAPSQGIAEDLIVNFAVRPDRVSVIANPVDAAMICEAGSARFERPFPGQYAVVVSRLHRGKNVELVLNALARARGDLSLAVVGDGAELPRLRAAAARLGLRERVKFLGFLTNPYPVMKSAAFYVSGSNGEGFPNALVEALALGVPVISTNCASGPSEILDDAPREAVKGVHRGAFGVLVPPNDVHAMAEAFALIERGDERARYRAVGPARADAFGVANACEQVWAVIDRAL